MLADCPCRRSCNLIPVERTHIGDLLQPFLADLRLTDAQLEQFGNYLDLLLRWNARVNLTSVRDPTSIVTRHFGESLFLARQLFPAPAINTDAETVLDLGSGAGFPGLPLKIYAPHVKLTLVESNHKKAAFLREAIRALALHEADVFAGRGEDLAFRSSNETYSGYPPSLLTMRAVERFDQALEWAQTLVKPGGRLALLVGSDQAQRLSSSSTLRWDKPVTIPGSERRVILIGRVEPEK